MRDDIRALIKELSYRQRRIGISDAEIARRTGISQPTVHRILKGKSEHMRLDHILDISEILGYRPHWKILYSEEDLIEREADNKAKKIVRMLQGTSALESQGLSAKQLKDFERRTKRELMGASARKIWQDD